MVLAGPGSASPEMFPDWAYPPCVRPPPRQSAGGAEPMSVPGSDIHYTAAEIARLPAAPGWFPHEHSPLPDFLAASHSDKAACAYCHLPDGSGRPENARLTGLSSSYIFAQVRAIHMGDRRSAKQDWPPTALMRDAVANLTDGQILE